MASCLAYPRIAPNAPADTDDDVPLISSEEISEPSGSVAKGAENDASQCGSDGSDPGAQSLFPRSKQGEGLTK